MNELLAVLRRHADGTRIALIEARAGHAEFSVSYDDLLTHVEALGNALPQGSDPRSQRIVAVACRSPLRQMIATLAAIANGMIVNLINPALSTAMMKGQLQHAQPDLLVIDDAADVPLDSPCHTVRWTRLFRDAALAPYSTDSRGPTEGGLLIYTSGTTGSPKGVLLPWSHIAANVRYAIDALGMSPGWIAGSLLPRFHSFTLISDIFPALLLGGCAVLTDSFEAAHAAHIAETFRRHGIQSYSAAPIILETCCALNVFEQVSTLRFAVAGAAPLKEKTRREYAQSFGHPIIPCYGLTETTCFATISPPDAIRPDSVGVPAGIEICVFAEDGQSLPTGHTGELHMRGPSVIRSGYFRDSEGRFAEAFASDGWLRTGDIGRFDADGYIYITGRKKNMVIRGGEKIHLEDIDRCLAAMPGVIDCASVALCRPQETDLALTFVVADGVPPARILMHKRVRDTLTARHVPDRLYFVESIPRTRTGKIAASALLALATEFESAEPVVP